MNACAFENSIAVVPDVLAEMKLLQYLSVPGHKNVMSAVEVLEDDLFYYLVLPYFKGRELFSWIADYRWPNSPATVRAVADQLNSGA